jgi:hypothetical protein
MKSLLAGCLGLIAEAAPAFSVDPQAVPGQGANPPGGNRVVWLILRTGLTKDANTTAIPTKSMEQCEISGAEFRASKRFMSQMGNDLRGFECLEGIR